MSACIIAPNKPGSNGYVMITVGGGGRGKKGAGGRRMLAHRWAWEQTHGPVPPGLFVLHRCDTPACWNVEHLHLGTQKDNMGECSQRGRAHRPPRKTHCPHGHEYTPENTYKAPSDGRRMCRICIRECSARARKRRRG